MTFLLTMLVGTSGVLIVSSLYDASLTDTMIALWHGTTPTFQGGSLTSTGPKPNTNQTPSGTSTFGSGLVRIQL